MVERRKPRGEPGFAIFLVDDDEDDRRIFKQVLTELNEQLTVHLFETATELLDYLRGAKNLPEIIFLDLHLPGMDGRECLREIRANPDYEDICVVIYSNTMDMALVEKLFESGANRYLRKPVTPQQLRQALERTITSVKRNPTGGISIINCS